MWTDVACRVCCSYIIAAEQKARAVYDNILRISDNPDVNNVIKFLREREVVHFQRFGEAKLLFYTDFRKFFQAADCRLWGWQTLFKLHSAYIN